MPILQLLASLIFTGVGLYLINVFLPMNRKIMKSINVLVIIIVWVSSVFGIIDAISGMRLEW